jgi:hypothetical protein
MQWNMDNNNNNNNNICLFVACEILEIFMNVGVQE